AANTVKNLTIQISQRYRLPCAAAADLNAHHVALSRQQFSRDALSTQWPGMRSPGLWSRRMRSKHDALFLSWCFFQSHMGFPDHYATDRTKPIAIQYYSTRHTGTTGSVYHTDDVTQSTLGCQSQIRPLAHSSSCCYNTLWKGARLQPAFHIQDFLSYK